MSFAPRRLLGLRSVVLLTLIVGLLCSAAEARAQEEKKPKRLKVAVFVQQNPNVKIRVLDKLLSRIKRGLRKRNKRIKLVRPARILASFSGDLPSDDIAQGRKKLRQGYRLLEQKFYRRAITAFNQALVAMTKALAYTKKSRLAQAQFGLALAYYYSGLPAQAKRQLRKLFTWRRRMRLNLDTLPKRFRKMLIKARKWAKKRPVGRLVLSTRPVQAKVFINGRGVGRTPLDLEGVPVGEHYLTVRKRGYLKLAEIIQIVSPKKPTKLEFMLKRSRKYILLEQALSRSWPDFGKARATPAMQEVKTLLLIDQIVLIKPSVPSADGVKVDVCLYDLRTGNRLKRLSVTLKKPKYKAYELAEALYKNVRYDGTLPDPGKEDAPTLGGPKPIYKRWWFWVSIGAAVAATVIGISVPLATRDPGKRIDPGYNGVKVNF